MEFKRLEYCGQHVTTGTVSGVPTTTPTNEGSEHLVIDANGNILEYYIWSKDSTGTSKWVGGKYKQTDPLDVNNTAINYVPTASGNTNNRNSIVTDPAGDKWIIDANGDATKVTTTFTDVKYSKLVFVDPVNGNNTTGTGSDNKMFQTIAKALSTTDGSGWRVVLAPGTYVENPTVQWPNVDIVTVAGSKRGNTYIQGTVTFTHTSSSSGIQGIKMTNLVHSGAGALYITDCQVDTLLNKTSAGYIEVSDTQLQGTSTSTLSAGTGLIRDSLIANMTISGATSGYTLKSNIVDATGTVTFAGGAIYNLQDNTGNIVTTAGVNMETALIAAGLPSATAKQYMTNFSNKLAMLHPDTNNANVNMVSWNSTSKRLEITDVATISGDKYATTSTTCQNVGTASGDITIQVAAGLSYLPLQTIVMQDATNSSNHMHCDIVSYNKTTGVMVVNVKQKTGTGNICNWIVGPDSFNVTATTVVVTQTNTSGEKIGTVTVNGVATDLFESICALGSFGYSNGTLSITFTDEAGAITTRTIGIPNALWATATTNPTATGNTGALPRFVENTVNGSKWYIDGNGVAKVIEQATIGGQNVYFNAETPTAGTIFDTENPPVTNNNALKNNSDNTYYGTDGSVWTWNGTAYVTKVYSYPLHQREVKTATASQTLFTLTKTPIGGTEKVHVSRNGIDISRAFTWVGNVGTYNPADNYGCSLDNLDTLQFHFESN